MSLEKPNARKSVQLFRGLYYYVVFFSTTGCQTGSPNREKYTATTPLYLETGIQKTCPTKPSPTQLKLSTGPSSLCINLLLTCVSPLTLCINPLRHCAASRTLCVTPTTLCVDDASPLVSTLSLLGSAWPVLASVSASLPLRWSLGTISTSLCSTHCPSLLITNSTLLSNLVLVNRMTEHSGVFSNWPSSLFLYFSCWSFNG